MEYLFLGISRQKRRCELVHKIFQFVPDLLYSVRCTDLIYRPGRGIDQYLCVSFEQYILDQLNAQIVYNEILCRRISQGA